ncbi:MAG: tetratricopeptide repeat protein [Dokdonia sp.]|jgi:tetratricopeptide (TPR) repeat protein
MMDEKTMLLFDDYLQGALSAPQQKDLEQRLANEPELADAFVIFRELNGHLSHHYSEERASFAAQLRLKAQEHAPTQEAETKKTTKVIRLRPLQYFVAASIVLLFGAILWSQLAVPTYNDYQIEQPISLSIRSEGEIAFAKAEEAFNTGDYEMAVLFFNSILSNTPDNVEVQYYKAIALTQQDNYEEADNLYKALWEGSSVYKYKALWRHALSKLKQKDRASAKALLEQIPPEAEDYEHAQDLLDKL